MQRAARQQRMDDQTGGRHHHGFTEGVEAAEIHDHHVHHIAAAGFRQRPFKVVRGACLEGTHHDGPGDGAQPKACDRAQRCITQLACVAIGCCAGLCRQIAQRKHHEQERDAFNQQLRERKVGRREADKYEADHQPDDAHA